MRSCRRRDASVRDDATWHGKSLHCLDKELKTIQPKALPPRIQTLADLANKWDGKFGYGLTNELSEFVAAGGAKGCKEAKKGGNDECQRWPFPECWKNESVTEVAPRSW